LAALNEGIGDDDRIVAGPTTTVNTPDQLPTYLILPGNMNARGVINICLMRFGILVMYETQYNFY
jgi:hypothetical protein